MGWTDLGCFGSDFYETPHIDRLAAGGMRFTNAYAACPVCSPTRASIMTGKYPARLKLTNFIAGRRQLPNARVLARRLQALPGAGRGDDRRGPEAGRLRDRPPRQVAPGRAGLLSRAAGVRRVGSRRAGRHFGRRRSRIRRRRNSPRTPTSPSSSPTGPSGSSRTTRTGRSPLNLCHFAVHIPLEAREKLIAKYEAKAKAHPGTRHNNPTYAAMIEHVDQSVGRVMETLRRLKHRRPHGRHLLLRQRRPLGQGGPQDAFDDQRPVAGRQGLSLRRRHPRAPDRPLARGHQARERLRRAGVQRRFLSHDPGAGRDQRRSQARSRRRERRAALEADAAGSAAMLSIGTIPISPTRAGCPGRPCVRATGS